MKKLFLLVSCACSLIISNAFAQEFQVRLELAYRTFIVGEPVLVRVTLENQSRDTIRVRRGGLDKVFFEVTGSDIYDYVKPCSTAPTLGEFELAPGKVIQKKLELDKWFPLIKEKKYLARAIFLHRGMRYESQKKSFDVVPGILLQTGTQMFVKPESLKRSFSLVWWHRNQADRIFLKCSDEPGDYIWDTVDLGNFMRSQPPKLDIAPDGVVTVVHRSNQNSFFRTVLWSLPESLEVVERNNLLDPEISASQHAKTVYGEMAGEKKAEEKSWWEFWK